MTGILAIREIPKNIYERDKSLDAYVNLVVKIGGNLTFDAFYVNKGHTLK